MISSVEHSVTMFGWNNPSSNYVTFSMKSALRLNLLHTNMLRFQRTVSEQNKYLCTVKQYELCALRNISYNTLPSSQTDYLCNFAAFNNLIPIAHITVYILVNCALAGTHNMLICETFIGMLICENFIGMFIWKSILITLRTVVDAY